MAQVKKSAPMLVTSERNPRKYCPGPEAVENIPSARIFYHKPPAPVQVLFLYPFFIICTEGGKYYAQKIEAFRPLLCVPAQVPR